MFILVICVHCTWDMVHYYTGSRHQETCVLAMNGCTLSPTLLIDNTQIDREIQAVTDWC